MVEGRLSRAEGELSIYNFKRDSTLTRKLGGMSRILLDRLVDEAAGSVG